jgi:hypothetical protein
LARIASISCMKHKAKLLKILKILTLVWFQTASAADYISMHGQLLVDPQNKGVMIMGGYGVGKSYLTSLFLQNFSDIKFLADDMMAVKTGNGKILAGPLPGRPFTIYHRELNTDPLEAGYVQYTVPAHQRYEGFVEVEKIVFLNVGTAEADVKTEIHQSGTVESSLEGEIVSRFKALKTIDPSLDIEKLNTDIAAKSWKITLPRNPQARFSDAVELGDILMRNLTIPARCILILKNL